MASNSWVPEAAALGAAVAAAALGAAVAAAAASVGLLFTGEDPVVAEVWLGTSLTRGDEPLGADAAEVSTSLQSR